MSQTAHAVLPKSTHDEAAREDFSASLRKLFTTELFPGTRKLYESRLLPAFQAEHGRKPETVKEVESLMEESFFYRATNLLGRTAQELVWDTVGESIDRQLETLIDHAKPKDADLGTLTLDPSLPIPRYIEAVDIHVMPGNFHTEIAPTTSSRAHSTTGGCTSSPSVGWAIATTAMGTPSPLISRNISPT